MAKRTRDTRFKVSDAFVYSCRAYVAKDLDNAFLWAVKVIELAERYGLHLTDNERIYLEDVLKRKKGTIVPPPSED